MSSAASPATPPRFAPRHVQLARAGLAAIAALMITFSPDHSAAVGLSVFSGYAIALGIVLAAAAWIVCPRGARASTILLAVVTLVAGMVTGFPPLRTDVLFFVVVIVWAALSGVIELVSGVRRLRRANEPQERSDARDAVVVGALGLVLAASLACVPVGYRLVYEIEEAGAFTLTGITIAVGIFGGYAALVAVYLGIAGLSPRRAPVPAEESA